MPVRCYNYMRLLLCTAASGWELIKNYNKSARNRQQNPTKKDIVWPKKKKSMHYFDKNAEITWQKKYIVVR